MVYQRKNGFYPQDCGYPRIAFVASDTDATVVAFVVGWIHSDSSVVAARLDLGSDHPARRMACLRES